MIRPPNRRPRHEDMEVECQAQGAGGLAHKGRGKPGNRRLAASLRKRALATVQRKYADYGPTLATECLAEEEKIQVHPETLRRWGIAAG